MVSTPFRPCRYDPEPFAPFAARIRLGTLTRLVTWGDVVKYTLPPVPPLPPEGGPTDVDLTGTNAAAPDPPMPVLTRHVSVSPTFTDNKSNRLTSSHGDDSMVDETRSMLSPLLIRLSFSPCQISRIVPESVCR